MHPIVVTVFDSESGTSTEYSFANSPVRIGRNPLNDLSLPFPFVSGWHAVVRFDANQAKFFDLGSTNGTLHDGRRVGAGESVPVEAQVAVTIGKLELRIRRGGDATRAAPPNLVAQSPFIPTSAPNMPMTTPARSPAAAPGASSMPAGAHNTAHVELADVHQAVNQLRGQYSGYRQAWQALLTGINGSLAQMPPEAHGFAVSILQREFPEIAGEPEFAAVASAAGASLPTASSGGNAGRSEVVDQLARSLCPGDPVPKAPAEVARFMSCVEDVLRASAKAFVELQKGQEQFGNEMGVRTIKEYTALHAAGTAENVLRYLLDWQSGGPHRTQELVGVYADLMIHQVALINGVMEGVRSLLARLSPAEIERGVSSGWASRGAATWKHYAEQYQALTGSDRTVTAAVFGPEFARAYAEVGGEGAE